MKRVSPAKKRAFQQGLLKWYRVGRRRFSWRDRQRNAYQILIAEMMLRKTDATKVAGIYDQFISRHRSPESVAGTSEAVLRQETELLGIADRARLLRLQARELVQKYGGRVPNDFNTLISLAGVGPYTANAVLCFAYRKDVPLLDTNVIRILGRVFSAYSAKRRARDDGNLWRFAGSLIPTRKGVSYNRALLDHAAQICTHRSPRCSECPVASICDFYAARSA